MFALIPPDEALRAIWKSKALPKLKVFAWLLMKDRLNTRYLILRKNWKLDSGPVSVMCGNQSLETRDHLFFECDFAKKCWDFCSIQWDTSMTISQRFVSAITDFVGPCFMEVAICVAWNVWKERNGLIFNKTTPSFGRWKVKCQSDVLLHQ
jgi:hypothetical protein